jgi:hypothetical protein
MPCPLLGFIQIYLSMQYNFLMKFRTAFIASYLSFSKKLIFEEKFQSSQHMHAII